MWVVIPVKVKVKVIYAHYTRKFEKLSRFEQHFSFVYPYLIVEIKIFKSICIYLEFFI